MKLLQQGLKKGDLLKAVIFQNTLEVRMGKKHGQGGMELSKRPQRQ